MDIFLAVIWGILGAAIGSFLNVCIDRLPANQSLITPSSHCDACGRHLNVFELVPVLSYLALRGRCRICGARIPLRVLWVELGCGIWLALLFHFKGLNVESVIIALYSFIFIAIALIDLKHKLILNKIVYPSLIAALIIAPFFIKIGPGHEGLINHGIINALIGAAVGFVFLLIPVVVTGGRGMGIGDVKMAALIGLTTGFPEVLVAIMGGIILGGLTAIFLLLLRIKKRKEVIPFGPFLSLATIITLLWGSGILDWYKGLYMH
jgi:leader peptidase (prepilin peptidase) / N-methyltransferase